MKRVEVKSLPKSFQTGRLVGNWFDRPAIRTYLAELKRFSAASQSTTFQKAAM